MQRLCLKKRGKKGSQQDWDSMHCHFISPSMPLLIGIVVGILQHLALRFSVSGDGIPATVLIKE
jgi:hypothetical protein